MIKNEDLAAVHGYLCGDGYVVRNPISQKHKYYYIGLRNTNITLLKDFQKRFETVLGVRPIITNGKDRCKAQNKNLYFHLTKTFGSFYSHHWSLPQMNRACLSKWLRAYFDCDGWVRVLKAKDRKIGLESVNKTGLLTKTTPRDFADNLELVLGNKRTRNRIGKNAQVSARKKFNKNAVAKKVENVYKEVITA